MNRPEKTSDAPVRAREILLESVRTIWYLRLILPGLHLLFVILTIGMFYYDGTGLMWRTQRS
jgi:voltage-gated potassium channel